MPKGKRGFAKGQSGNPNGRKNGAPNKTTKEARELFISIMNGEIENVQEALSRVLEEAPSKYLDALAKLLQYTMPKQIDVTSDGDKITDVNVTYINKLNEHTGEPGS
jgi:hypothetical protein